MKSPLDPRDSEEEIFRAFGLACRIERDRLSLAGLAEHDRRFEDHSADERAIADAFAARLIASIVARH